MNISDLKNSNYLTKADVEPPIAVTVGGLTNENMAQEGHQPEMRFVLNFSSGEKPMVLNSTNGQLIALALGSDETDDWIGKQITLYNDKTVSFGGKLTGGIRVQVPVQGTVQGAVSTTASNIGQPDHSGFDEKGDAIPF